MTDDEGVTNVTLDWQILQENEQVNSSRWARLFMGSANGVLWKTSS